MHASRRTCLGAAAVCAIAMTVVVTAPAQAGTYVMHNCNVPGAPRSGLGPWQITGGGGTFANNDCPAGGGFGLNSGLMTSGYVAGVAFGADPAVAIRRVRLWLVARLAGTGSALNVVTQFSDGVTTPPAVGLFGPPGGETLSAPYVSPDLPASTRVFAVYLTCGIETGTGCNPNSLNVLDIKGAEVTYEESTLPKAAIDGGELLTAGPQSGVRTLAYSASDAESGIARVSALIGKTVVATSDFAAECAYAAQAACPQTRNTPIAVDTRKVPDGTYPVSLVVTDAAGNEQTAQASTAITVVNATPESASTALVSNARLTAAFAANRHSTLTVGYGRRVVIRGRLRRPDGGPIGGAQIAFEERQTSRTAPVATGVATTGADGVFSFAVGRGTSRMLRLTYSGAPAAVKELKLRVKSSATLRVRLDGIVVRYRGRVRSKPLPRKGKLVEIQGRAPGAGWRTFARRRASRRGVFAGTYRLRIHRPGVRLQFRVRVPAEAGYAFVAHAGRTVTRIVH
jgi:hypothetical protein